MGLLNWWKHEERADTQSEQKVSDSDTGISAALLKTLMGKTEMSREEALEIPSINSAIGIIAATVSSLPVKLYKERENEVEEVRKDRRLFILNHDTGDTLTATQFWKAMLEDYYLGKGAYAYINKNLTQWISLHHVENEHISFMKNTNPIFKDYTIMVDGMEYPKYSFLKILRNTKDGFKSQPIQEEAKTMLSIAYHTMRFEENLVKKGGNKKGFLKSEHPLTKDAITDIKESFKNLYSNNSDNIVLLNKGIEFQEASNSSVEMQLNENKETNSTELSMLLRVPIAIVKGNATQKDIDNYIDYCIVPLITDIEASLDRDLLTEEEKESGYYFAFDIKELKRGNIKERYEAYEIAYKNNFMQIDEIREKEDMKPLGFEFIKLGLDSVLYNPKTGEVYTPNTNETTNMRLMKKGGEKQNESGIKS